MRPVLFRYHTVNECLCALRAYHSAEHPGEATYEKLGEALGLRSRTQSKRLFKGELKIGRKLLEDITRVFSLTPEESSYLDLLRRFEDTQNPEQAFVLFQKINADRLRTLGEHATHVLTPQQLTILDRWYIFPVLHYFDLKNHTCDPESVSRHFAGKISAVEAMLAIDSLENSGLIERLPEGGFRKVHSFTSLLDGLPRPLVKKYHQMMIERSLDAVYGVPQEKRMLMAATIPTNHSLLPLIRVRISNFLTQLNEEFSSSSPETLYQINLQLLHLASTETTPTADESAALLSASDGAQKKHSDQRSFQG